MSFWHILEENAVCGTTTNPKPQCERQHRDRHASPGALAPLTAAGSSLKASHVKPVPSSAAGTSQHSSSLNSHPEGRSQLLCLVHKLKTILHSSRDMEGILCPQTQ